MISLFFFLVASSSSFSSFTFETNKRRRKECRRGDKFSQTFSTRCIYEHLFIHLPNAIIIYYKVTVSFDCSAYIYIYLFNVQSYFLTYLLPYVDVWEKESSKKNFFIFILLFLTVDVRTHAHTDMYGKTSIYSVSSKERFLSSFHSSFISYTL